MSFLVFNVQRWVIIRLSTLINQIVDEDNHVSKLASVQKQLNCEYMRYEYDYFSLLLIDEEAAHTLMYVYIDFFKLFVTSNK